MKWFPEVTEIADDNWRLDADLLVHVTQPRPLLLFVPKGFQTDLASVPRVCWNLIAPFDDGMAGPIVHDWLYRHGGQARVGATGSTILLLSKADADGILNDLMEQDGVSTWRRVATYKAVQWFGGSSWQTTQHKLITP